MSSPGFECNNLNHLLLYLNAQEPGFTRSGGSDYHKICASETDRKNAMTRLGHLFPGLRFEAPTGGDNKDKIIFGATAALTERLYSGLASGTIKQADLESIRNKALDAMGIKRSPPPKPPSPPSSPVPTSSPSREFDYGCSPHVFRYMQWIDPAFELTDLGVSISKRSSKSELAEMRKLFPGLEPHWRRSFDGSERIYYQRTEISSYLKSGKAPDFNVFLTKKWWEDGLPRRVVTPPSPSRIEATTPSHVPASLLPLRSPPLATAISAVTVASSSSSSVAGSSSSPSSSSTSGSVLSSIPVVTSVSGEVLKASSGSSSSSGFDCRNSAHLLMYLQTIDPKFSLANAYSYHTSYGTSEADRKNAIAMLGRLLPGLRCEAPTSGDKIIVERAELTDFLELGLASGTIKRADLDSIREKALGLIISPPPRRPQFIDEEPKHIMKFMNWLDPDLKLNRFGKKISKQVRLAPETVDIESDPAVLTIKMRFPRLSYHLKREAENHITIIFEFDDVYEYIKSSYRVPAFFHEFLYTTEWWKDGLPPRDPVLPSPSNSPITILTPSGIEVFPASSSSSSSGSSSNSPSRSSTPVGISGVRGSSTPVPRPVSGTSTPSSGFPSSFSGRMKVILTDFFEPEQILIRPLVDMVFSYYKSPTPTTVGDIVPKEYHDDPEVFYGGRIYYLSEDRIPIVEDWLSEIEHLIGSEGVAKIERRLRKNQYWRENELEFNNPQTRSRAIRSKLDIIITDTMHIMLNKLQIDDGYRNLYREGELKRKHLPNRKSQVYIDKALAMTAEDVRKYLFVHCEDPDYYRDAQPDLSSGASSSSVLSSTPIGISGAMVSSVVSSVPRPVPAATSTSPSVALTSFPTRLKASLVAYFAPTHILPPPLVDMIFSYCRSPTIGDVISEEHHQIVNLFQYHIFYNCISKDRISLVKEWLMQTEDLIGPEGFKKIKERMKRHSLIKDIKVDWETTKEDPNSAFKSLVTKLFIIVSDTMYIMTGNLRLVEAYHVHIYEKHGGQVRKGNMICEGSSVYRSMARALTCDHVARYLLPHCEDPDYFTDCSLSSLSLSSGSAGSSTIGIRETSADKKIDFKDDFEGHPEHHRPEPSKKHIDFCHRRSDTALTSLARCIFNKSFTIYFHAGITPITEVIRQVKSAIPHFYNFEFKRKHAHVGSGRTLTDTTDLENAELHIDSSADGGASSSSPSVVSGGGSE